MKNSIIEKYINEITWSPDRGAPEIYNEIIDFMEEKMSDFEIWKDSAGDQGHLAKADLDRTFNNLDNLWESFKKMLGFMIKKIEKYDRGRKDES